MNPDSYRIHSSENMNDSFKPDAQPPSYQDLNYKSDLNEILIRYEIDLELGKRLELLREYKIVYIFDDSSSMNERLEDSPLNKGNYGEKVTRWQELELFGSISIEIATYFDPNGVDIYFLNHYPTLKGIKSCKEFQAIFRKLRANGYTELTKILTAVFDDNFERMRKKEKLLIIIVTDGEPTNHLGSGDVVGFRKCLCNRRIDYSFISIIACTDQKDIMRYLNGIDKDIKNLDVKKINLFCFVF
jgi:hypothetical protein